MFTGIVQHVGVVERVESTGDGRRLVIDVGPLAEGLARGGSVAVRGACLTVVEIDARQAGFDVVAETLDRTNLGQLTAHARVNLERALRVGDCLDGHIVQGHVDGQARVQRVDRTAGRWDVHLTCDGSLTDEMAPKASVAVDGVSLTLVNVRRGQFSVTLIPTTLAETTLGQWRGGEMVNVETDVLGKYVRRLLDRREAEGSDLTLEGLRRAGFA